MQPSPFSLKVPDADVADLRIPSSGTGNSANTARHIVGLLETQWQRGDTGAAA